MKSPKILCLALAILFATTASLPGFASPAPVFLSAKPVWPTGRENEKNLLVGFHGAFAVPNQGKVFLRSTGSTLYRVFLNGQFLGQGPARGPHGFYRLDEWDLTGKLNAGTNDLAFEVAGYNVNSYYLLDQSSFLQAEVICNGTPLLTTSGAGSNFSATILKERVQKVQRYSFQRPFSEVYRLTAGWTDWRVGKAAPQLAQVSIQPEKTIIDRLTPYPDYALRQPSTLVAEGGIKTGLAVEKPWKDRSLTDIGPKLGGYPERELESIPSLELQGMTNAFFRSVLRPVKTADKLELSALTWKSVDFGRNLTGFIGQKVSCRTKTRLVITFDEILSDGDVDFKRLGCVNIISYELAPGEYDLESFEPYTLRYMKLMVTEGDCVVGPVYLREMSYPEVSRAQFAASDTRFNRLFEAGIETFRQNALDIFMDCPSRERAGWLCDSYFTARVAKDLAGDARIEKSFLENYLMPRSFQFLPDGMLPMCYPADHNDGVFIPNWSLWFVVQLGEYLERSGDRELIDALRPKVMKLLDYFQKFQNSDGLLEKLESWVFVEWSAANSFVQDVNYPSNMLYAKALLVAGRLYGVPTLADQAERIREVIRKQSYDGSFFVDNALRRDGKLTVTSNRTEVCQYFAFYFDIATPQTYANLWGKLLKDFGPQRKQTKAFPEIHPANAFIGNVLRLELLSRDGLSRQLLDESLAYQLYMVERTGTLWENDGAYASCNHGFASHGGVHLLYRDVLGLRNVDTVGKRVQVRFANLDLAWCEGRLPTPDGPARLRWEKRGLDLSYSIEVPAGYTVAVENQSGLTLVRSP
jgi:alpha-L-rhamnosidase